MGRVLGAGYAAMQFVFASIIGNLSNRFGRRPVLLACLFAFAIAAYRWGPRQIGLPLAMVGVGSALVQGLLLAG